MSCLDDGVLCLFCKCVFFCFFLREGQSYSSVCVVCCSYDTVILNVCLEFTVCSVCDVCLCCSSSFSLCLLCADGLCVCICVYSCLASEEGDSFFSHLFGWGASGFCMLLAKRSESHLPISLCVCVSVCVAGCGGSNTFSSCVRCVHHTLTMFMYFLLSFYSLSRHHLLIAYSTAILYLPKCWCSFAWFFF